MRTAAAVVLFFACAGAAVEQRALDIGAGSVWVLWVGAIIAFFVALTPER